MVDEQTVRDMAAKSNLAVVEELDMKTLLKSYHSSLNLVKELCEIEDPSTEPYKSKYEARQILVKTRTELLGQKVVSQVNGGLLAEDLEVLSDRIANLDYLLGKVAMDTEETHSAEDHLMDALDQFLPGLGDSINKLHPVVYDDKQSTKEVNLNDLPEITLEKRLYPFCQSAIDTLNQLGILWCNRGLHHRAINFLESSRRLFNWWNDNNQTKLEKEQLISLHIHTLFYLAQVFGHLAKPEQSALYCFKTLNLQMESNNLNPVEWSLNCMKLAEYYIGKEVFHQAGHFLCACDQVMKTLEGEKDDDIYKTLADLHRVEGTLYLAVLKKARDFKSAKLSLKQESELVGIPELKFKTISFVDDLSLYPEKIQDFDSARSCFKKGMAAFLQAHSFYVLDGYVTEHVEIARNISALYNYLTVFESDERRIIAMHNRRVTLLSSFLKELNKNIYAGMLKQLSFELGETYGEMMEYKLKRFESKDNMSSSVMKKCNAVGLQTISSFEFFIALYNENGSRPKSLDENEIGPYLRAHFYIARMHGKLLHSERKECTFSLQQSLKMYEETMKLAEHFGAHQTDTFRCEYQLCKEMVALLPEKINRIHYCSFEK